MKEKKGRLVQLAVWLAAVMGLLLPQVSTHTWAAECPYGGTAQKIGEAGCRFCGGSGLTFEGSPEGNMVAGSGVEVVVIAAGESRTEIYYRCHNCGVCEQTEANKIKTVTITFANGKETVISGSGRAAGGSVPLRQCSKCGNHLKAEGRKYYVDASYQVPHRQPEPTPTPVLKYYLDTYAEQGGYVDGDWGYFRQGDAVSVSAVAYSGYRFVGWSGAYESALAKFCFLMPAKDVALTASFVTVTPTPTPAITQKVTPVPSATPAPSVTPTPRPTRVPLPNPTATPVPTTPPRPTTTPVPTVTPYPTATPIPLPEPISDIHDDNCYTGEEHRHTASCLTKVRCSNGCTLHRHTGSPSSGTGCYTGTYHAGGIYYCGGTLYSSRTETVPGGKSPTASYYCLNCEENVAVVFDSYTITYFKCTVCSTGVNAEYDSYGIYLPEHSYRCDCCDAVLGRTTSYYDSYEGERHAQVSTGYYEQNCGKTNRYCKNGVICSVCHGAGTVGGLCDKTAGAYYEGETLCAALCDKVLYTIQPLIAGTQILRPGELPNTQAYIGYYAQMHMLFPDTIETCELVDFRSNLINQEQEVTIRFGGDGYYLNSAKSAIHYMAAKLKVMIDGTYTVDFDANGGAVDMERKQVVFQSRYGELPIPARSGYRFTGWYTQRTGGSLITADWVVAQTENHTLYAQWLPESYTVYFDAAGGIASLPSKQITYAAAYGTLPIAAKQGYTFAGWMLGEHGITAESKVMTAADHTLKALWIPNTQQVTFNAAGGEVSPAGKTVTYQAAYGELPVPTRSGYCFANWWYGDQVITEDTVVLAYSDHTIVAEWTPKSYTITWHPNGGSCSVSSTAVTMGMPYAGSVEDMQIIRDGYAFDGWYTEDGYKVYDADKRCIDEGIYFCAGKWSYAQDVTLYAHWRICTYRITLDGQGATIVRQKYVNITYGETGAQVVTPLRTGYQFLGYFAEPGGQGTRYYDKRGQGIAPWETGTDGTIYAFWLPNRYVVQYLGNGAKEGSMENSHHSYGVPQRLNENRYRKQNTVTYEYETMDGGSTDAVLEQLEPIHTIATGIFAGWSLRPAEQPTYADQEVVQNLTMLDGVTVRLFASWKPGSVILPEITRTGYCFRGWSSRFDGAGLCRYPGEVCPVAEDITLYAQWTPLCKTVTLDGQGAEMQAQSEVVMTFDWIAPDVVIPVRPAYVFSGYYTKPNGQGTKVYDKQGKGQKAWNGSFWDGIVTLYAYWLPKEITDAEVSIFSIDATYVVTANPVSDPELPTFEWREFGDTMLEISMKTIGHFDYAEIAAPWEEEVRTIYWSEGTFSEEENTWTKDENVVFWRSSLKYPEEEDRVREYPGYLNQTYTIPVTFYVEDRPVKEYKLGLYLVSWEVWGAFIHPSSDGGRWDFNGDGIWDRWPFCNGQ